MSSNAETPRSRSKLTKALVATGVGVALLTGGGGTFAAWSDSATVKPGAITAGTLEFGERTAGSWKSVTTGHTIGAIGSYRIVPGETISYTERVKVVAVGAALSYELGTNIDASGDVSGDLADDLEAIAEITVNGARVTEPLTLEQGTKNIDVTVTITLPSDSANDTRNQEFTLRDITVTARQTAPAVAAPPQG